MTAYHVFVPDRSRDEFLRPRAASADDSSVSSSTRRNSRKEALAFVQGILRVIAIRSESKDSTFGRSLRCILSSSLAISSG